MNSGSRSSDAVSTVTVRRYGQTIILEPRQPRKRGGSVSVAPSFWSDLVAAVDALWRRTAVKTRGEAALAMVRAGIALEEAIEPALGASRLMQRQLDLARGLAADPAGIVLRGFFDRLNARTAESLMGVLREVANRGVACYIVAGNAREAELAARAVRLVFGPPLPIGRGNIRGLRLGFA
jgi:ABC-type branched-subunit amino acid transport system ATPase component